MGKFTSPSRHRDRHTGHCSDAAAAATDPRATSPFALASSIAERYWGAVPCHGQIKILVEQRSPTHPWPGRRCLGHVLLLAGANNLAAPAGSYTNCTISLGR